MSQKYDILPMASKYDISPQQFLFRPSSTSPNTNIPFTTPPTSIPMASTTEAPPASTTTTLHRLPSPRHSTSSDSIASTSARLIYPTSHHIAQRDYTSTIYPTTILRLLAALLIISIILYATSAPQRSIPALVFISLALIRILAVFISHTPRGARWRGRRGANLVVDFGLVAAIAGSVGGAFVRNRERYWEPSQASNVGASILGWISCGLIALAAVDTGRPTRIAYTSTLSLDFWTGEGAVSLDNWDAERPEMGRSASLLV